MISGGRYLAAIEALLRFLFGDAAVDEAIEEREITEEASGLPAPIPAPMPVLVAEVDAMIERLRTLIANVPDGAPPRLALSDGLDDLAWRVTESIGEAGMEWGEELQELTGEYSAWLSDPEIDPASADEAIDELCKLRPISFSPSSDRYRPRPARNPVHPADGQCALGSRRIGNSDREPRAADELGEVPLAHTRGPGRICRHQCMRGIDRLDGWHDGIGQEAEGLVACVQRVE